MFTSKCLRFHSRDTDHTLFSLDYAVSKLCVGAESCKCLTTCVHCCGWVSGNGSGNRTNAAILSLLLRVIS